MRISEEVSLMNEKNNFVPGQKPKNYYSQDRPEMLQFIPRGAGRILDVGCGAGNFGGLLKSYMDVEVWGIEILAGAASEAASRIDRVVVCDIEREDLPLPTDYFDCIVFNDVLEHLQDPWNTLMRCRTLLRRDGFVVASIPNVRYHPNIRRLLVEKRWEYEECGVLDRTHLRFFTMRSIEEMFIKCGYSVRTIKGLKPRKFSNKVKILNFFLGNSLEDMKYLQFACVAQKRGNS